MCDISGSGLSQIKQVKIFMFITHHPTTTSSSHQSLYKEPTPAQPSPVSDCLRTCFTEVSTFAWQDDDDPWCWCWVWLALCLVTSGLILTTLTFSRNRHLPLIFNGILRRLTIVNNWVKSKVQTLNSAALCKDSCLWSLILAQ